MTRPAFGWSGYPVPNFLPDREPIILTPIDRFSEKLPTVVFHIHAARVALEKPGPITSECATILGPNQ
jgi:hypothetical protein